MCLQHNCLNRAVKERLLVRNPADNVIAPKIDKKEMKILPPEQVKAYLKAATPIRLIALPQEIVKLHEKILNGAGIEHLRFQPAP